MMARTQITLPPETHRRARAKAADQGISLAEYIRRLVEHDLVLDTPEGKVALLFDLGDSAGSDVAAHKHRYLGEAFDADR